MSKPIRDGICDRLRAWEPGVSITPPDAIMKEAAAWIEQHRSEIAILKAALRPLTNVERQSMEWAIEVSESLETCGATGTDGEPSRETAALRGLLERLGGGE